MKGTLGYFLLGGGFGAVVFRIAEIDNAPEWKAWIVFIIFFAGLILILEDYKKTTKEEMRTELEDKLEEIRGE